MVLASLQNLQVGSSWSCLALRLFHLDELYRALCLLIWGLPFLDRRLSEVSPGIATHPAGAYFPVISENALGFLPITPRLDHLLLAAELGLYALFVVYAFC